MNCDTFTHTTVKSFNFEAARALIRRKQGLHSLLVRCLYRISWFWAPNFAAWSLFGWEIPLQVYTTQLGEHMVNNNVVFNVPDVTQIGDYITAIASAGIFARGGTQVTRAYIKESTYSWNRHSVCQKKSRFAWTGAGPRGNGRQWWRVYCSHPQVRDG